MNKTILLLVIISLIALVGCVQEPMVGQDCGTVSPDSRNECCARVMKDVPHIMCVGNWKYLPDQNVCAFLCTTSEITNFDECIAAGNPAMESYPRQCRANGQTFVEVLDAPIQPPQPIGGQKDEYGCLGPAGYSYNAEIGACIREWEIQDNMRKAAKIAVNTVGSEKGLTIIDVLIARCPGCFVVEMEKGKDRIRVTIENWQVVEQSMTPEECRAIGGRPVNTVGGNTCDLGETNVGRVTGFISPNICCVYR